MKTPTLEELRYIPTEEQVSATIARIGATGNLRRSIPVQVDDDDIVLDNLFEDWKRLREAHELPGAGGGERTGSKDDAAQADAASGMEAARGGGTAGDATGAVIAGEMAPAGPAAQVVEFRHEPWQAFRALGPIDTARALYLAINFERHTIYRDDFRWLVDSLLAARDESAVAVKAAQEERDARLAAESALRLARDTCDGSCDIALARRQVGPDGIVPGNAKECAELWERESSRLAAEAIRWRRGVEDANRIAQEHDRARQAAEERLAELGGGEHGEASRAGPWELRQVSPGDLGEVVRFEIEHEGGSTRFMGEAARNHCAALNAACQIAGDRVIWPTALPEVRLHAGSRTA